MIENHLRGASRLPEAIGRTLPPWSLRARRRPRDLGNRARPTPPGVSRLTLTGRGNLNATGREGVETAGGSGGGA